MIKLFKYLKPYRGWVILIISLTFIQSLSQLYLPALMSKIVDQGVVGQDIGLIIQTGLVMLGFTVIVSAATIFARLFGAKVSVGFARDLRRNVFVTVENYSLHEFDQIGTSSLITRSTNDITQIQNVMLLILSMLIMAPLMLVGGLIMSLSTDLQLSWVIAGIVAALGIVIGFVAIKGVPLFRSIQKKLDRVNLILRESLTGIRVIRAFNKEEHERGRFEEANARLNPNLDQGVPHHERHVSRDDADHEYGIRHRCLVRFPPCGCRRHSGRRYDGVYPICDDDYVLNHDGDHVICHAAESQCFCRPCFRGDEPEKRYH